MMVLTAQLKQRYERSTNTGVDHLLSIYSLHRRSKVFHARYLLSLTVEYKKTLQYNAVREAVDIAAPRASPFSFFPPSSVVLVMFWCS